MTLMRDIKRWPGEPSEEELEQYQKGSSDYPEKGSKPLKEDEIGPSKQKYVPIEDIPAEGLTPEEALLKKGSHQRVEIEMEEPEKEIIEEGEKEFEEKATIPQQSKERIGSRKAASKKTGADISYVRKFSSKKGKGRKPRKIKIQKAS